MKNLIFLILLIFNTSYVHASGNCIGEPPDRKELYPTKILSVVGSSRLQFYSSPNLNCSMNGVFVIPGDQVTGIFTYSSSGINWYFIRYISSKTGNSTDGWVNSNQLRLIGDAFNVKH